MKGRHEARNRGETPPASWATTPKRHSAVIHQPTRNRMSDEAKKQMLAALGRVASGLFVLTARHDGQETGMLASWVQQAAFDPPQLTVAVRRGRGVLDWLTDGTSFTLNILDDSQTDMIAHFGKGFALGEPAF